MVGSGVANIVEEYGFVRRAASLAVGYDAMMRGADMTSFRRKYVSFLQKKAIVRTAFTTTLGYRRADSELAIVTHPFAFRLLRRAMRVHENLDSLLMIRSAGAPRAP